MRTKDIEIAEKVLGWKRYGAYVGGERIVVVAPNGGECFKFGKTDRGNWDWTFDNPTTDMGVPNFSNDPEMVKRLEEVTS